MKKCFTLLIALTMLLATGCGSNPSSENESAISAPVLESQETVLSSGSEPIPTNNGAAHEVTYVSARAYGDSIGTTWVQTIFEVTNTGDVDLYLSAGAYDLEDINGTLLASQSLVSCYPEVISPGEKAYYYEETTLEDAAADIELVAIPRPKVVEAKVPNTRFVISDFELQSDPMSSLKMLGRVENTNVDESTMTNIACVMYDSSGVPIGVLATMLMETLAAQDKIGFEASAWMLPEDVTLDTVASYETFAYPTQMQF